MKRVIINYIFLAIIFSSPVFGQDFMTNVYGRKVQSLNGKWQAIVDPYDYGNKRKVYHNRKPQEKTQFYEYSFDNSLVLNVPSDWNSQYPELDYYENTIWYGRHFDVRRNNDERIFLYFAGVNYRCSVHLNGKLVGEHEGGFTPFQIEVTNGLKEDENFLAVKVNNTRTEDAIPAMSFDWWNYGGITRDVFLITTPEVYINDYFLQSDKNHPHQISGWVQLGGNKDETSVKVNIPELGIKYQTITDKKGYAAVSFSSKQLQRWSSQSPKLYEVEISTPFDTIAEAIGFRNIEAKGTQIYINDEPIFLKSISFHEEIPQRKGRAHSEADAAMLLSEAKELGCNMVRLSHYPQNEHIVRLAEKMGFILWEEIPIWQGIDFENESTYQKAETMLREMIRRDKNRCAIGFWSMANETKPSVARDIFLEKLINCCRVSDPTRLVTVAFDLPYYNEEKNRFEMEDKITDLLDMISINKYMGWYMPFPTAPATIGWYINPDKPLFFSEFGGEAVYGQKGEDDVAHSWSEEYQEKLYKDNILMFENVANLVGISPWILFDFRSPTRFHPLCQQGWNRKGLISDQGYRKKAWYVMREYYDRK